MKPLKDELKDYRKQGVRLFLNGNPSTPKCIAKACMIAEDGGYMRDYTADEEGRIAKVNLNISGNFPKQKMINTCFYIHKMIAAIFRYKCSFPSRT